VPCVSLNLDVDEDVEEIRAQTIVSMPVLDIQITIMAVSRRREPDG